MTGAPAGDLFDEVAPVKMHLQDAVIESRLGSESLVAQEESKAIGPLP